MLMGGSVAISMKRTRLPPISQLIDQLNDAESDNPNESEVNSSTMSHGHGIAGEESSASTQSYHYALPLSGRPRIGSVSDVVASQHQQQQQQQQKHIESLQNMGFSFTSPIGPSMNRPLYNLGIMPGAQHPSETTTYYVPTQGGPYTLSPQSSMGPSLSANIGGYAPTITTASTSAGSSSGMVKQSDEQQQQQHFQVVNAGSVSPSAPIKREDEHVHYCTCQDSQLATHPQTQPQQQHIPRPRNAFILFRQHWHRQIFNQEKEKINADTKGAASKLGSFRANSQASRDIGQRWRSLSDSERQYWLDLAKQEKECHKRKYPDYTYVPTRKSKRNSHSSKNATTESTSYSSASNLHKQTHCPSCNRPKIQNQNQNQNQIQNQTLVQNIDQTHNQS